MAIDVLEREINVGDFVVFHNNLYEVIETGAAPDSYIKIFQVYKSPTTKPIRKYCKFMCLIDKQAVLAWKSKHGY